MKISTEDVKPAVMNIDIGIKGYEIDRLIRLLKDLKENPDSHFHISSNFDGTCRIGDLTFYMVSDSESDDIVMTGLAQGPGTVIEGL